MQLNRIYYVLIGLLAAFSSHFAGAEESNFERLIHSTPMVAALFYNQNPGSLVDVFAQASKTPRFRFSGIQFIKADENEPGIADAMSKYDIREVLLPIIVLFRDGQLVTDDKKNFVGLGGDAKVEEVRDFIDDYFSDLIEGAIKYSKEHQGEFTSTATEQDLYADYAAGYADAVSYEPLSYSINTRWSEPSWWPGYSRSIYYRPYVAGYVPLYRPGYRPGWYRPGRPAHWYDNRPGQRPQRPDRDPDRPTRPDPKPEPKPDDDGKDDRPGRPKPGDDDKPERPNRPRPGDDDKAERPSRPRPGDDDKDKRPGRPSMRPGDGANARPARPNIRPGDGVSQRPARPSVMPSDGVDQRPTTRPNIRPGDGVSQRPARPSVMPADDALKRPASGRNQSDRRVNRGAQVNTRQRDMREISREARPSRSGAEQRGSRVSTSERKGSSAARMRGQSGRSRAQDRGRDNTREERNER